MIQWNSKGQLTKEKQPKQKAILHFSRMVHGSGDCHTSGMVGTSVLRAKEYSDEGKDCIKQYWCETMGRKMPEEDN